MKAEGETRVFQGNSGTQNGKKKKKKRFWGVFAGFYWHCVE